MTTLTGAREDVKNSAIARSLKLDAARFERELGRRGLNAREFAQLAGVTEVTLSRARHGRSLHPSTLQRITRALLAAPVLPGADLVLSAPGRE